mgnify:CR=1 FL=1
MTKLLPYIAAFISAEAFNMGLHLGLAGFVGVYMGLVAIIYAITLNN